MPGSDGAPSTNAIADALLARLGRVAGIAGLTIIDEHGNPAAASGEADPRRDSVLTAFLATRVRAITAEGDLRGKGRQLRESRLLHASCSGRNREFLVIPTGPVTAFATVKHGAYADIVLEDIQNSLRPR